MRDSFFQIHWTTFNRLDPTSPLVGTLFGDKSFAGRAMLMGTEYGR
jgi:hypothetical protein